MDAKGIRIFENGQDWNPAIDLETDIMTLLAILRPTIAEFHRNEGEVDPTAIIALNPAEAAAITGGMPVPDPAQ
ncbi:MAG: hypothetical protein L3J36_01090 [Rhodobacteraceae bacterium]|nr:hypothetical protein [Paracoccaceae bacterium]